MDKKKLKQLIVDFINDANKSEIEIPMTQLSVIDKIFKELLFNQIDYETNGWQVDFWLTYKHPKIYDYYILSGGLWRGQFILRKEKDLEEQVNMLIDDYTKLFSKYPILKEKKFNEQLKCKCRTKDVCFLATVEEMMFDLGLDLEDIPDLYSLQEYIDFYKDIKENGIFIYNLSEKYRNFLKS